MKRPTMVYVTYPATVEGWMEHIASDRDLARRMLVLILRNQPQLLRPAIK